MEIKLKRAYISYWDNIEYPIYQFADGSYLCIAYSISHQNYYLDRYTKEDFIKQGFEESEWENHLFEDIDPDKIGFSIY